MNGNPSSAQKKFHNELREMYRSGELHHIFGSKRKIYKYKKAGEWIVILISPIDHRNIDLGGLGFEWEKQTFEKQKNNYEAYYGKPCPIPSGLIDAFFCMKWKSQAMAGFSPWGDDV